MAVGTTVTLPQIPSTNLQPEYLFSNFVPTVAVTDESGNTYNMLDIYAPTAIDAINSLNTVNYWRFRNEKITNIAFKVYNNTTCYWMILLASEVIFPLTITQGSLLNLPNIQAVTASLTAQTTNNNRIPRFVNI